LTVPLPEPFAPAVIVTHDAWLVAVQGHPASAETLAEPVEPAAETETLVGESV
jgi:hypothetical protein